MWDRHLVLITNNFFLSRRQNRIIRHSLQYNISSFGENSTMIVECSSSYSVSPEDRVFEREDKIWSGGPMLA